MLHKKGAKVDIGNYRPISMLPVFSKVLETVIHLRFSHFSDDYGLLKSARFGFSKNLLTEAALVAQWEYTLEKFKNKKDSNWRLR